MTETISMSALYTKLAAIGFPKKFVRESALPSWWNDELNDKPVAVLEGAGHIARRLHLDLKSLLEDKQEPQFKPLPQTKFKYHQQGKSDVPSAAHQLASRVAEVVANATHLEFKPIPSDPSQVRAEIIRKHPKVNLDSLLDYCWQQGIAVVYFNHYPKGKGSRKITGMIQWVGDRPVIVLSGGKNYSACFAFDLAHELGHLALGHIKEGILIDDEIKQDSDDQEEIDSNHFAVNLLVDNFDNFLGNKEFRLAKHLKHSISKVLEINPTLDPCALAFNYAWHNKEFRLATGCAKLIPHSQEGKSTINHFLEKHINWDDLSDDNSDYLDLILGE